MVAGVLLSGLLCPGVRADERTVSFQASGPALQGLRLDADDDWSLLSTLHFSAPIDAVLQVNQLLYVAYAGKYVVRLDVSDPVHPVGRGVFALTAPLRAMAGANPPPLVPLTAEQETTRLAEIGPRSAQTYRDYRRVHPLIVAGGVTAGLGLAMVAGGVPLILAPSGPGVDSGAVFEVLGGVLLEIFGGLHLVIGLGLLGSGVNSQHEDQRPVRDPAWRIAY